MACTKAVIFDYIGTLVNCRGYSMEASRENSMRRWWLKASRLPKTNFLHAYFLAHEKYRKVRYEELREVTNAVWVAEALGNLGFDVTADDSALKLHLNVFFQDFIDTLELREGAKKLIKQAQPNAKSA